jgi:HEAT repeat protein
MTLEFGTEAAKALAKLGPEGESVLLVAAGDADAGIRSRVMEAMADCETDATMEALLRGVKDEDESVRAAAVRSLNRREQLPPSRMEPRPESVEPK